MFFTLKCFASLISCVFRFSQLLIFRLVHFLGIFEKTIVLFFQFIRRKVLRGTILSNFPEAITTAIIANAINRVIIIELGNSGTVGVGEVEDIGVFEVSGVGDEVGLVDEDGELEEE